LVVDYKSPSKRDGTAHWTDDQGLFWLWGGEIYSDDMSMSAPSLFVTLPIVSLSYYFGQQGATSLVTCGTTILLMENEYNKILAYLLMRAQEPFIGALAIFFGCMVVLKV
jgi:hypothetical protein